MCVTNFRCFFCITLFAYEFSLCFSLSLHGEAYPQQGECTHRACRPDKDTSWATLNTVVQKALSTGSNTSQHASRFTNICYTFTLGRIIKRAGWLEQLTVTRLYYLRGNDERTLVGSRVNLCAFVNGVLSSPVDLKAYPNIKPACLPITETKSDMYGRSAVVSGWGIDAYEGIRSSNLNKVPGQILSDCGQSSLNGS